MRIFVVSDIHIDFQENQRWVNRISKTEYKNDILLLAGDVCHNFDRLKAALMQIRPRFKRLFFVPGNHDLWIRGEAFKNSLEKFDFIIQFCRDNDISVYPEKADDKWILPIFSWYSKPEEGEDTLYWTKPGEDESNRMWSDNFFIKWPNLKFPKSASRYFFNLNSDKLVENYNGTVISMSHFIPRKELIFGQYPPVFDPERIKKYDRSPEFNFSRVAGSELIERQIRQTGSRLHIYGHQHINRDIIIEDVRYVSHCLGYPNERKKGLVSGIEQGLKKVM